VWFQAAVGTITVVYDLTAPDVADSYTIAGTIGGVDWSQAVGGETGITVGVPPEATTATRDIADQTLAPGDTTQVTVTIDVAEAEALALDENPPAGWTLTRVSEDPAASAFNANTNEWVWFQAAVGTITVVYDLTVPSDADGSYTIDGRIVGVDWSQAVVGEVDITVGPPEEGVELEFRDSLAKGERDTLVDIPGGATELEITLDATADIDLELYDGTTFVIGWNAIISSSGSTTRTYHGDTFAYSGWAGGDEYITADGPLSRAYTLKVYGYEAGDYVVTVSYMPGPPDETPPEITITAPDGTVGIPTTIEVSATDLSGVQMIWFGVYAEEYPEEWGEGSPVVMICTFDDEGSVTFTPGWAATYIVEAIAVDNSEAHNATPEDVPVTATFVVVE